MRREITLRYSIVALCAGALLFLTLGLAAHPQDDKGPNNPSGPNRDVGETVLVPKKTPPSTPGAATPDSGSQPVTPPEKINPKEIYTLTTSTNLVNVDVLVVDKDGNPISGLTKANFKLADEGVPQSISNFATGDAPMTVCMLIEFSNTSWYILYTTLQYSYEFVRVIEPKDWVAVVTFDMNPTILTDFTQNRSEVLGALNLLRIPGFSEINLFDALAFTIDRMKDIQGRKAILAICTGWDTFSKLTYDQTLKLVRNSDTIIYPISILEFADLRIPGGLGISGAQARAALTYIAKYSGGQAYFPRFVQDMPGIYGQISQQLRNQYSLGFIPSNNSRDGKFRKLKIELVDERGNPLIIPNQKGKAVKYKVIAREGYYSPKS
ncbi:MAG: VWA domain-containing protein [Acidobacteria bacterium]|nr:VWA domain-containing protein [Acidobacteriota bacterium]